MPHFGAARAGTRCPEAWRLGVIEMSQTATCQPQRPEILPTWAGETETKRIFLPTGQYRANGQPVLRPITIRYIVLTHARYEPLRFTVTHITRNGFRGTTICDHRPEATGHHGTTGIWGTRKSAKAGKAQSYGPSAWVDEVTHLIGAQQAWELLIEQGYDWSTRQI